MVTSSGVDVGVSSGSVETTIADSDADQMVIPGADVRRRVYSPGIDDETAVRLRRVVTIMTLSVGLRL
jgi:hypothetical protein